MLERVRTAAQECLTYASTWLIPSKNLESVLSNLNGYINGMLYRNCLGVSAIE